METLSLHTPQSRRSFLGTAAVATAGLGLTAGTSIFLPEKRIFKISLAEWSLNGILFGGKMDHLDFPVHARHHGIEAIEYVNQFFMQKAEDMAYLKEMKNRADGEGVKSLLIMCDGEGKLGDPDESLRIESVEKHKKWVHAAAFLGCHSIRVNGFSQAGWGEAGHYEEELKLVADGLRRLCEFADEHDINVMIENHGGNSSHGKWLKSVMELADHPRAGTLPDFGNFRIDKERTYDSYRGVDELMPYAFGVSVKPRVWDDRGNESDLDYVRMMRIVLDHGYRGYCGIEHGTRDEPWAGIMKVKHGLEKAHAKLVDHYS